MNLTLVITTSLLPLFHLGLEGPDHQEEIGPKHPAKAVDDSVSDGEENESLQDIKDLEDKADPSQDDPRLHEADVPLKNKDIGDQQNKKYKDIGDQ